MKNKTHLRSSDPFFSIVVPTYNRSHELKKAISSIIHQTFSRWECLIIDDGSSDGTTEMVGEFKDSRIRYYFKEHEERSAARNLGIEKAEGLFICFLDSDDIYFTNHLASLYEKIHEQNYSDGLYHTEVSIYQKNRKMLVNWFRGLNNRQVLLALVEGRSLYINGVCISSQILRIHKFPREFSYWEDQHLWIRILVEYPFYSIPRITTQWNIHDGNSVVLNFVKEPYRSLDSYLRCINDVEHLLENRLLGSKKKIEKLKLIKTEKFFRNSFIEGKFSRSLGQYLISIRHTSWKKTTKIYLNAFRKVYINKKG